MTPDWEKIKTQYIEGSESYAALARRWGVGQRNLALRGRDEGWPQLRAQHRRGAAENSAAPTPGNEAAPASAAPALAPLAPLSGEAASMARIEAVTDRLLEKAEILLDREDVDAQTIQRLASAIKTVKETKGLRTDPDAREQEAKIRGLELKNRAEDEVDNTIIVQLGDAAKYAV